MFGNGFYNPYMYQPYYQTASMARNLGGLAGASASNLGRGLGSVAGASGTAAKAGGIGGLLSKFSFSGFLNGASKTLNVVNQAIPIFYQVRPMINNAKTMFRIMGAVKDDDKPTRVTASSSRSNRNSNTTLEHHTISNQETMHTSQVIENNPSVENPIFFI